MKHPLLLAVAVAASSFLSLHAQVGPIFENGQAQKVPLFENPKEWIREDIWVETEFDTDGDGILDRMQISQPQQEPLLMMFHFRHLDCNLLQLQESFRFATHLGQVKFS